MDLDPKAIRSPTSDELRIYEIFRRRIVEEDLLINNRISWLIWLQAALITAWGAIASGHTLRGFDKFYLLFFLGFFGLIMALAVLASVWGAHIEIKHCKSTYKAEYEELYYNRKIPRITGNKRAHLIGHIVPFAAPMMFCLAQLILIYSDFRLDANESVAVPPNREIQLPVMTPPARSGADTPKVR